MDTPNLDTLFKWLIGGDVSTDNPEHMRLVQKAMKEAEALKQGILVEREACAKIAEHHWNMYYRGIPSKMSIVDAIRARSDIDE
jgi:hypothetical protein